MAQNANGDVTIVCLTDSIHLRDLGVHLTRGSRVSVPLSVAMKSRDLVAAKLDNAVSTQTVRSSVIREQENVSSDTVTSQSPRHTALDLSPILVAVHQLADEVRGMRRDLAAILSSAPASPTADFAPLLAQIQGMVAQSSGEKTWQTHMAPPDRDEIFIPSNLTGSGDLTTTLKVSSESSVDQGVADAMAALKAARKKSKVE